MDPWSDFEDEVQVDVRALLKRRQLSQRKHRVVVKRQSHFTPHHPPPYLHAKTDDPEEMPEEGEEEEEEEEDDDSGSEGESSSDSGSDSDSSGSSSSSSDSEDSEDEEEDDDEDEGEEDESPSETPSPSPSSIGGAEEACAKGIPCTATGNVLAPIATFATQTRLASTCTETNFETALPNQRVGTSTDSAAEVTGTSLAESQSTESSGISSSSAKLSPAASGGIAVGAIALFALLVTGFVLLWRRRKRPTSSSYDNNEFPPEKAYYYSSETSFHQGNPNQIHYPQQSPRTQSDIMDQAMAAAYATESGGGHNAETQSRQSDYYNNDEYYRQAAINETMNKLEPSAPVPAHLPSETDAAAQAPAGANASPRNSQQGLGTWIESAPYPAPLAANPPMMQGRNVTPPPVAINYHPPVTQQGNVDVYPPGQMPLGKYRVPSMAQTEVTTTTESSWRTWNVTQDHAQKQKGWKEKYLR